jgi:probable F420-dependent oxidoreductase
VRPYLAIKLAGLVPHWAATVGDLPALGAEFERLGADEVVCGEHILYGADMRHPGGSGRIHHSRTEQRSDGVDVFVLFSAVAALTTRLRLCSAVVLGAAHPAALLARQGAALDVISCGRFVLGVGAGWYGGEFEAMGIPPAERDARLGETVAACKELWSPGPSSFDGKWNSFTDMICEPAPATPDGPPIWWGMKGTTPAAGRRVVTMGDGWIANEAASIIDIAQSVDNIHTACLDAGRDPASVGIRATLALLPAARQASRPGAPEVDVLPAAPGTDAVIEHALASAERLTAVGVTHLTVPLDSYELDLEGLGRLLQALHSQGGSS